jgi:hypothetical protein
MPEAQHPKSSHPPGHAQADFGEAIGIIGGVERKIRTWLLLLNEWLPSPSYKSLAIQSLFIAAIGLLLAENNFSRASLSGWGLIGFSGWLAFMAKPTTAVALGFVVGLLLSGSSQAEFSPLGLFPSTCGCASALLCVGYWWRDSRVRRAIEEWREFLREMVRILYRRWYCEVGPLAAWAGRKVRSGMRHDPRACCGLPEFLAPTINRSLSIVISTLAAIAAHFWIFDASLEAP